MYHTVNKVLELTYNRELFEEIMVWPGYLTETKPELLGEIENELGVDFMADGRNKTGKLCAFIPRSKRGDIGVSIEFRLDGKIGISLSSRAKSIATYDVGIIVEWIANAMIVLSKYKLV